MVRMHRDRGRERERKKNRGAAWERGDGHGGKIRGRAGQTQGRGGTEKKEET